MKKKIESKRIHICSVNQRDHKILWFHHKYTLTACVRVFYGSSYDVYTQPIQPTVPSENRSGVCLIQRLEELEN